MTGPSRAVATLAAALVLASCSAQEHAPPSAAPVGRATTGTSPPARTPESTPRVEQEHRPAARRTRRPAFPGAEGFGTRTPGGRGGRVIAVTTLRSGGKGSLRAAVRARGPRIVVFRVSGTIRLKRDIEIVEPYLTIAGQTAPGGGVTLRADSCNGKGVLGVHTHDVVIRFLRLRPGPHACAGPGESSDGIVIYKEGTRRVVVDHCSISWAVDENVSLYDDAHHVTLSWNIISEGLAHSTHEEGEHSKGAHLSGEDTYAVSFHHNLLAHNNDRNPQPTNPGVADIRNNVVYDYGEHAALASNSHGRPSFNFVGNVYVPGPDSDRSEHELDVYDGSGEGWAFYVRGNVGPHRRSGEPHAWSVSPEGRPWIVPRPFRAPAVTTTSAPRAYRDVLARAGAVFPHRDRVDRRVVRDVRRRTGGIIDHPRQVGGWPRLPAARPPADRDRDGMPDRWERRHGLRPRVDDSARDADRDGWTNVEEYLHSLVRRSLRR